VAARGVDARPQGTQNSTLIRTRPLGPSGRDAAPFGSNSGPVSETASDCFGHRQTLGTNLEVNLIFVESARDNLSNKKKIHPIWTSYAKVVLV
jgi:hypothetical protein